MLDEALRARISEEASHYETPRAACVEALLAVQRAHRWISDPDLEEVAGLLGMSPAELDSVATFYSFIFRRPVGERVIAVCDGVSCWMLGADRVCRRLKDRLGVGLGGTTADGRFTLLPASCLGRCEHAPVALIGTVPHGDLDERAIDAILDAAGVG